MRRGKEARKDVSGRGADGTAKKYLGSRRAKKATRVRNGAWVLLEAILCPALPRSTTAAPEPLTPATTPVELAAGISFPLLTFAS